MKEYTIDVNHSRELITSLEQLSNHLKSAQIYTPTYENIPEKRFYILYKQQADLINRDTLSLKELIKDNPLQLRRISRITNLIGALSEDLINKNVSEMIQSGQGYKLDFLFTINKAIEDEIQHEEKHLSESRDDLETSTGNANVLSILFSISAIGVLLATFVWNLLLTRKGKWLEGFLQSVLDTSQNAIVTYKPVRENGVIVDFKIEFANAALENLLGMNPAGVTGKLLSEIRLFVTETDLFSRYIKVAETGMPDHFEIRLERNKHNWLYVMLTKLNEGVLATFHNISDLKRYEEDLKENIKQLETSNTELEQFAYVASHDLQEPLRKIRTYGSYLKDRYDSFDEKSIQHLDKILSSAERMSKLINDILNFSSLKRQVYFVKTDLNQILKSVMEDLDLLITQKEATIKWDELPVIDAIPLQMTQLFYNLLINAIKFALPGNKPLLEIKSRSLGRDEISTNKSLNGNLDYCEIIFSDNGIGFNPDFAKQIFGLFKRLNDRQEYPGTGIGLTLCKKVIDNHNGIIYASGKENEGAQFHIILPLKHHQN